MAKSIELPLNPHLVSGIKLKADPIQFDGDCVDPYAKFVIAEALDFAIENALKRLKKAGQTITDVETHGFPALQIVQGLRNAFEKAPSCPRELTSQEKDMVATYRAREGIKKAKAEKPKPRAEALTTVVWNTMPIAERSELAEKVGMEGKRGAAAAGSFKKAEWESLVKAYLGEAPPKAPPAPPPPVEELIKLLVVTKRDPVTRVSETVGFDVVDPKTLKVARRITREEGVELLKEAKAKIVW